MASIKLRHVNGFTDRHGQVRHYFRRRGHKAIPLPGFPASKRSWPPIARRSVPTRQGARDRFKPDAAGDHQRADRVLLQVG